MAEKEVHILSSRSLSCRQIIDILPLSGRRISTFSFVAKSEQHFQVGFNYTALTARPPLEKLEKRISAFLFAIVFCANSRRLCKRRRRPLCKVIEAQRPCSWLQNNILPPFAVIE